MSHLESRKGVTMAEVMVAVAIIALATGPLIALLTSSNRMSNASIYEEMAVHYARELSDQLLRMDHRLSDIVNDARVNSGNSSIKLEDILTDTTFINKLEAHETKPVCIPLQVNGTVLEQRIIVSPLHKFFQKRRISLEEMNTSSNTVLKTGKFWKVIFTLGWKDPSAPGPALKEIKVGAFLHEK